MTLLAVIAGSILIYTAAAYTARDLDGFPYYLAAGLVLGVGYIALYILVT